jgi:hypothetical protein
MEGEQMGITTKASDLYYKYGKDTVNRYRPKFRGKPDRDPFNRDDIYEVLPMLGAVMDELDRDDQHTLHLAEEILISYMPRFVNRREEVFDFLVACTREGLENN